MATVKLEILTDVNRCTIQQGKCVFVFNGINEDGKIVHFTCDAQKDAMMMKIRKDMYYAFNAHIIKSS